MKKILAVAVLGLGLSLGVQASTKQQDPQVVIKKAAAETNSLLELGALEATKRLKENKGFAPFAFALNKDGNVMLIEAEGPLKGQLSIAANIEFLRGQIIEAVRVAKEKNVDVVAAGIFSDSVAKMTSGDKQRGVAVEFEHATGLSTIQFVPYTFDADGHVKMGESVTKVKSVLFFRSQAEIDAQIKALENASKKTTEKTDQKTVKK